MTENRVVGQKVTDSLERPTMRRFKDLEEIVRLAKKSPGETILAELNVTRSRIFTTRNWVREGRGEFAPTETGKLRIQERRSGIIDGVQVCDLFFTWEEQEKEGK